MLQPLGDRVLIKQKVEESKSGIILADDDVRRLPTGYIVALGNSLAVVMSRLEVGDLVHFNSLAGERLQDGTVEYLIVKLQDVLAKVV